MIISNCTDCNHRNICKYRDEYESVIKDITVKVPEPFTLVLNCKHYYSTTCYLNSHTYGDSDWATGYLNAAQNVVSPHITGSPEVVY